MMRLLTEKRPLGWRQSGFRSPLLRPVMGIALLAFVALNLVLVLRVMADSNVSPALRSPASGRGVSARDPSLDQLTAALQRAGRTGIGASSLSDLAFVPKNDRAGTVTPRETSTQGTGSGSTSSGSTNTGTGSGSGGSDGSSSGDSTDGGPGWTGDGGGSGGGWTGDGGGSGGGGGGP